MRGEKRSSRDSNRKMTKSSKKKKTKAPDQQSGPSAAFLAALEDQRERERRRQTAAPDAAAPDDAASRAPPPPLAGFYFDAAQRCYFRLTPQIKQQQQQQRASEQEAAARRARRARLTTSSSSSSGGLRRLSALQAATSSSWLAYVADRERSAAWGAGPRDRREAAQRVFVSRTARDALQPLELRFAEPTRRITALDFAATTGGAVGAIALGGGRVDVFSVGFASDLRSGFATRGERRVTLEAQYFSPSFHQVSALRWQAGDDALGSAPTLLCAGVGGAPSEQLEGPMGEVALLRNGRRQKWRFADPWSLAWNPARPESFAVGLAGPVCAAYIDASTANGVVRAPRGKVASDVMAQAFTRDGNTVFNGTRSGAAWLWDVRARRRAYEHHVATAAAIVDLHVLRDGVQVVVLKSDGELSLVDARSFRTVVEFAAGSANTFSPALQCAVDASEAMVVAASGGGCENEPPAVCSYAISSGRLVCSVVAPSASSSTAPLQQVHLRETRAGVPELWAASRSELFASAGRDG